MKLSLRRLSNAEATQWDSLVERSNEGTLFHRLDFLRYHGDRFQDQEHHLVFVNGEALCGVLPLAIMNKGSVLAAQSPYGGSVGGPVFDRVLSYRDSMASVNLLTEYLNSIGVASCSFTLPIRCSHLQYSDTFRLALLEHGFKCVNRDISSVIELPIDSDIEGRFDSRARNMARKAERSGIQVAARASLDAFWEVLVSTYRKLGETPTHTLEQLKWLAEHHRDRIYADVAFSEGTPVAGVGYFVLNQRTTSTFYIAQDPAYQHLQAISLLLSKGLRDAQSAGFRWCDLGTSSAAEKGRANLFLFKESFGAIGEFRETFRWDA